MCETCEGQNFPKWKCVIGRCRELETYKVPDEEQEYIAEDTPNILFYVYKHAWKFSIQEQKIQVCHCVKREKNT